MPFSPELIALAHYLAGEFDNKEQALAEPAWYVHLRLWQRPVPLFTEDSFTLFAEQANIVNLDQPYRPRLMRLQEHHEQQGALQVQYYMPKEPLALRCAGRNPALLKTLVPEQFDLLPGCRLTVTKQQLAALYHFQATLQPGTRCCFTYRGNTQQVCLGFKATAEEFLSEDKGIDSTTGNATWEAILGPFRFHKRQDFTAEF
jgi:hypothetical protein